MATQQQQQRRHWYNDREMFLHGFVHSNYITSFTDWFMGLTGKATEIVLYATVLYSSAQLYPGVHLPAGLSLAVFLIQMGALDIGGLALGKLVFVKDIGDQFPIRFGAIVPFSRGNDNHIRGPFDNEKRDHCPFDHEKEKHLPPRVHPYSDAQESMCGVRPAHGHSVLGENAICEAQHQELMLNRALNLSK